MKFFQHSLWLLVFVMALCGFVSAQTTVCSGDTVVLVFNGHKQGNTTWQQSPDLITWDTAAGKPYNDSLIVMATNTYYYRAKVTDGTCSPFYSDTVMVEVNPVASPPNANAASNILVNSFDANWTASAGATGYFLDVATDAAFTAFVVGNKDVNVGNVTTYKDTGLTGSTTYYYRVRAANNFCGSSSNSNTITVTTTIPSYCTVHSTCSGGSGNIENITDSRDNKTYKTVQIGTQCWMAQNLNVGKIIPGNHQQIPGLDNQDTSIEKYCYGNVAAKCDTFGGLYSWDEMMAYNTSRTNVPGPQGICPTGWHIPVDSEWTCLEKTLGSNATVGGKLKDTTLWSSPNMGATNSSDFSALPACFRRFDGFSTPGYDGFFWTATEYDATNAWYRALSFSSDQVDRYYDYFGDPTKPLYGFSVRCVKDN